MKKLVCLPMEQGINSDYVRKGVKNKSPFLLYQTNLETLRINQTLKIFEKLTGLAVVKF